MELSLRIAVSTLLAAKGRFGMVPAGLEDTRFGLDIVVDPDNIGLQSMVPGPSTAGVIRRDSALAGLYIRPEGPFGCCTQSQAAGYMSALLLLLRACQPPQFPLAHRLWERVQ